MVVSLYADKSALQNGATDLIASFFATPQMMENAMAVGGIASVQYFQQSQQLSGQTVQLQLQKTSQASESLVSHSAANTVRNQQNTINTLQYSLQRGQALVQFA